MESPKRKSITGLNEALKRIRQRPLDPKDVERINELVRKDEEAEKRNKVFEKIDPEQDAGRELKRPVSERHDHSGGRRVLGESPTAC